MRVLLDASVSYEILEKVRSLIQKEPSVSSIRDLAGRNSGRYIFIEATITMHTTDLKKAHLASQKIEQLIKNEVPNIDRVLIHYEPEIKSKQRFAFTLSNRDGEISEEFGKSVCFALVDVGKKQKTILQSRIIDNPYIEVEKGRGIKVAQLLLQYKPDVVVVKEDLEGKGPGYAFADAGIEVVQTTAKTMDEFWVKLKN